jgi:pyrimidine operon attenuation protein/uracil phosphoribosyltransferase
MEQGRIIIQDRQFKLTIDRLCHQLIENHDDFKESCIVGIQPKGTFMANRLHGRLLQITGLRDIHLGMLDVTFYRDDFRIRSKPLNASPTHMDFLVENKRVILVDDVLYTGRTVRAGLTALEHYGRASSIELVSMVDRRFNRSLPIRADYVGIKVDALDEAYVRVHWKEVQGEDQILIFPRKEEPDPSS